MFYLKNISFESLKIYHTLFNRDGEYRGIFPRLDEMIAPVSISKIDRKKLITLTHV